MFLLIEQYDTHTNESCMNDKMDSLKEIDAHIVTRDDVSQSQLYVWVDNDYHSKYRTKPNQLLNVPFWCHRSGDGVHYSARNRTMAN